MYYRLAIIVVVAVALPAKAGPLEQAWYAPRELMSALAQRDHIRWAIPETLAARALVGGSDASCKTLFDDACKQWGFAWFETNGIVIIHRADDAGLKRWSDALADSGPAAIEAAWELGWLGDARAIEPLAAALASDDPAVALAAAHALEILARETPLGRDERVDALPAGRVSLASAFPLPNGLAGQLDSPYPAVRAAALRLLLAHGSPAADAAQAKAEADASLLVWRVLQQATYVPTRREPGKWDVIPPLPGDPAEVKAQCEKMVGELPGLKKHSGWEEMQHRVRIMAAWARAGSEPAADALLELMTTKFQFPGYLRKELSATASPKVKTRLLEIFHKDNHEPNRATLVRGLETGYYGAALMDFTHHHLDEQTVCYVTARKAGREAYDDLLALAAKGNYAAIDAVGVIGGPQAVPLLKTLLGKDEPNSATLAFRAAKALGHQGSIQAAEALLEATHSDNRLRRHAAALFLGRIGGDRAVARLRELLAKDEDRLVQAAAADALDQIGGDDNRAAVAKFRACDAAVPTAAYRPRNDRFGADFPVNEWVNLKIHIGALASYGEMGWNYDAANRLFFRYGGCSGYTNELTVFDLGTEQFVQRRPNEEMAGWEDRRPQSGCSGGRTWDPYCKVGWIGLSIGGNRLLDLAIEEYYRKDSGYTFCSYDLATDRFRPAHLREASYGEPAKRYAYDWKHGLMYPVKFQPASHKTKDWWAFDTKSADPYSVEAWLKKTNPDGAYPQGTYYVTAAVDQDAGLLVVHLPPSDSRPAQTWTYDPVKNLWKDMQPRKTPGAYFGAGFCWDPYHKLLLLQGGKKEPQYGGPTDSMTWIYDVRKNTWTDLQAKNGPGNPWMGAMGFDPEHNVFVVFNSRDANVWAYRYKPVAVGTVVE